MTTALKRPDSDRLTERITEGLDRVKAVTGDGESDTSMTDTAKELSDVLVSTDALLRTIDFDRLPEVIDVEELPSLVDFDRLSDAIRARDPELSFDLSHLERVVDERGLWNSVDLLEFGKAKHRLDEELEDVVGEDGLAGVGGDSKAVSDAKEFVTSLRPEAKQALVQQEALEKAKVARATVAKQHAAFERLYESNSRRFGDVNARRTARNPTAVSLLPSGPLPNSVSTRLSTVSPEVRYSIIDALPRIYGHRWRRLGSKRRR